MHQQQNLCSALPQRNAGQWLRTIRTLVGRAVLTAVFVSTVFSPQLLAQLPSFDQALIHNPMTPPPYYDTEGRGIQQTRDGGFINISNAWTTIAAEVSKYDNLGNLVWHNYYWEDPGIEPWAIHQTNQGDDGYVFVGQTADIPFSNALTFKIDDFGNILWYHAQDFGEESQARCVEVLNNNNYAVCGFLNEPAMTGNKIAYLTIYTPAGSVVSTHFFTFPSGGPCIFYDIRAYSLRQTANGDLILTGQFQRDCGPSVSDGVLLARLDISSGVNLLWANVYEASGYSLSGMDVRQTCDLGFVVAGSAEKIQGGAKRAFVVRTDANGTMNWSSLFGSGSLDCDAWAVEETAGGEFLVAGNVVNSNGKNRQFVARFADDGTLHMAGDYTMATTALGANSEQNLRDMEITDDGTFLMSGSSDGLGDSTAYPRTYVSNLICQHERQCNYTWHPQAAKITDLVEDVASNLIISAATPESGFVFYDDVSYDPLIHPGCPMQLPSDDQFVHHYNEHFDRAYAALPHTADYGSGTENVYTLTGWQADLPVSSIPDNYYNRHIPFLTHRGDGTVLSHSFLNFSGGGSSGAHANDIKLTGSGGFVIAGQRHYKHNGQLDHNAVMVRTDKTGVPDFTVVVGKSLGNLHQDDFQEIVTIPTAGGIDAGGYLAVGYVNRSTSNPDPDGLVVRVDPSGNVQWIKAYEIELRDELEFRSVEAIDKNGDGIADDGFIITGKSWGSWGTNGVANSDVFVMEIDGNGTIIWAKSYAASNWEPQSIIQTDDDGDGVSDDGFLICGSSLGNLLVLKLDNAGTIGWSRVFSRSTKDMGMSVVQRVDGGYALTGVTKFNDNSVSPSVNYNEQLYLVYLDASGNIETSEAAPIDSDYPAAEDCGMEINQLSDGAFHIAGSVCSYDQEGKGDFFSVKTGCQDLCTFHVLNDETTVPHSADVFNHVFDNCGTAGNTLCSHDLPTSEWVQDDEASKMASSVVEHQLCHWDEPCGQQSGLVTSSPENPAAALPQLTIAPNPLSDASPAIVSFPQALDAAATLVVYDMRGREVLQLALTEGQQQLELDVQQLPAGAYTMALHAGGVQRAAGSFVKQ